MSKNYSASTGFKNHDDHIRQIVQEEVEDFFMEIKSQIQTKIKQIDRNIRDLRIDLDSMIEWKNSSTADNTKLQKLSRIEQQIKELQKFRIDQIEKTDDLFGMVKNRSFSKEKNGLFKTSPMLNLNAIVFGDQNDKDHETGDNKNKGNSLERPPLPYPKKKSSEKIEKVAKTIQSDQRKLHDIENSNTENQPVSEEQQDEEQNPFITAENSNSGRSNRLVGELNKNKNTFLRKKSEKKIYTIPEQSVEESMLSNPQ